MERAGDRSIGIGLASSDQQRHAPWGVLMLTPDMEMFDCDVYRKRGCVYAGAWLAAVHALGGPNEWDVAIQCSNEVRSLDY